MTPFSRAPLRAVSPIAVLFLAACSGIDAPPTIEGTTFAPALGVNLAASTKTPDGEYYRDIATGTGALVSTGQTLSVHYTGWLSNGAQFTTNVGQAAFPFVLGGGTVITGWDKGFTGAHVGGTRQLIIPSEMGYGPQGNGLIPPNAILVYTVQIDSAQ
jgi:FKBP-type peptidyl-prolyl cis-trans isomerase FkpA